MGRLRKVSNDIEKVKASPYYFNGIIKNNLPNEIEIGMGKGIFIITKAFNNENINYYGIDKFPTVILKACNKLKNLASLSNLKFLAINVEKIFDYFPKHFFNVIYLNFSDPWPKKRHEKRRLTSSSFLKIYKEMLTTNGHVEFKTENDALYEFSLETLRNINDIEIIKYTNDFYKENKIEKHIQTEYEKKFIILGKKIKYISWKYKKSTS